MTLISTRRSLKNPMYTNEDVEDVVPGYQSGGYVALIAHK